MKLMILKTKEVALDGFINYWSSCYNYPLEAYYASTIHKKKYDNNDLAKLFIWKNGSKLSKKKEHALSKIEAKLEMINELKTCFSLEKYLKEFGFVNGAIWKIYLLHLINPKEFPIFDQHVYRAYIFITQNIIKEIPDSNSQKITIYFNAYIKFYNALLEKGVVRKKLDEALWAYGKFMKTEYGMYIWGHHTQLFFVEAHRFIPFHRFGN